VEDVRATMGVPHRNACNIIHFHAILTNEGNSVLEQG